MSIAQNREKFVISAKAGGINAITGDASVTSRGESGWQQLMITDDLNSGDRVRTAADGRVEILLNPGSYLRLGANSEVELLDNTLANLEVRLLRGTAIVEATGADGLELNIGISTPHTRLAIVRQGLYRLNVVPEDATELIVRKGRVILSDSHTKVKGGNKVVFSATNVSVAKLTDEEKKKKDDVEVWSKERAETVAKANRKVTDRMLSSAFANYGWSNSFFDRRALGLWFFNPRLGCYTFLPYFFGWGSPYGSSYSTAIYAPYYGPSGYYPRPGVGNNPPASGGSSGGQQYPTGGGYPTVRPSPPASTGGFGNGGNGGFTREPRMMNPETGNPAPRKNLERMPGQP
ncbi:MAG TPA: FecR family protein [Pyrinomonadaceae bacterium]|nr:FecR family protein [Pyrinomonadaceae bacterium]